MVVTQDGMDRWMDESMDLYLDGDKIRLEIRFKFLFACSGSIRQVRRGKIVGDSRQPVLCCV
jgi:hypothetical protein